MNFLLFVKFFIVLCFKMGYPKMLITGSSGFTYVDNVLYANSLALETGDPNGLNRLNNVAYGERTFFRTLAEVIRNSLSRYNPDISSFKIEYGGCGKGDVEYSLASTERKRHSDFMRFLVPPKGLIKR